jgi:hypothetical protein
MEGRDMEADGRRILAAKPCFEHLGGTLGCRIFARLIELGWFEPARDGTRYYRITEAGRQRLEKLGVDIHP